LNLNELTIKQAAEGLRKKDFSSVELTEAVLNVIKDKDKDINAFLSVTEELAMKQARAADELIADYEKVNPLVGVPVAVKDCILVEGEKCTAGSKILENYIAPYDATVIKKLKEAGAVIVGKTNMDEFAMGSSTENSAYGTTKNPYDLEKVPGGSSGGSAAAVAANETIFALGSDTGGSIRQPAGFCGVVGLKPTYGRISRYGLIAMASSHDQIGPLGKTVEDAEFALDAISGIDGFDSTSVLKDRRPDYSKRKEQFSLEKAIEEANTGDMSSAPLRGLKIGIPDEYFSEGIDKQVEEKIRESILKMENLGAEIISVSLPHTKYAMACYYIIIPSEVSSNMARYDGIKFGKSQSANDEAQNLLEIYLKSRGEYLGREVRRRIMLGTYVLSAGYYDAYYLRAQKVRTLVKRDFEKAFEQVDVLVAPISPTTAFKIGEKIDDPVKMYLADAYTIPVNLAALPALSLPCGFADGLPVGLQIIGRHWDERTILAVGKVYEKSN
jgi:aspartyl-tRNA(Asn)/glutamyl-tRNA(Gln) amidotransferase subunit A